MYLYLSYYGLSNVITFEIERGQKIRDQWKSYWYNDTFSDSLFFSDYLPNLGSKFINFSIVHDSLNRA